MKIEQYDKNKKYHEGDIIYVNSVLCIIVDRSDINELDLRLCSDRHILDYIRKLQYQHWMDRAALFDAYARIQSDYHDKYHCDKYKRFHHAAEVCKKVAHERYGS